MTTLADELAFLLPPLTGAQQVHATAWAEQSTAVTTSSGTVELGGAVVVHRHRSVRADGAVFEIVHVFQRDRDSDAVLLHAFDTLGFPPDPAAVGRWHDGRLEFERTTERGTARTVFEPTADGFGWSKAFRAPGGDAWQPVFTEQVSP